MIRIVTKDMMHRQLHALRYVVYVLIAVGLVLSVASSSNYTWMFFFFGVFIILFVYANKVFREAHAKVSRSDDVPGVDTPTE